MTDVSASIRRRFTSWQDAMNDSDVGVDECNRKRALFYDELASAYRDELLIVPTPAALSSHPEVQNLVADGEARGMERIKAIERLALSASIASCTCFTKTPDITFHAGDCRYVMLQYIIAQCEDFRAEAAAIRGETT